jgi:hypothetical protein
LSSSYSGSPTAEKKAKIIALQARLQTVFDATTDSALKAAIQPLLRIS